MPVFKKRRFTKAKKPKFSNAMVPRPIVNREKAHRHIVTCSTSPQESMYLQNTAGGVTQFVTAARTGPNMSVTFSLSEVVIYLAGLTAITLNPPSQSELVALYDTFQIEKVELSMWSGASSSDGATYTRPLPLIGHTVDTDDRNQTNITALQQYSTYKCFQLGQGYPLKATFVPCVAGTVVSGQTRLQKQDINTAYPNTPHYGYKLCVDGFNTVLGTDVTTLLSMQFRIHYLMKSTR